MLTAYLFDTKSFTNLSNFYVLKVQFKCKFCSRTLHKVLSGEILLAALRCAGCVVDDHTAVPIVNGPPLNFDEYCELRDDLRLRCYIPPKEAFKLMRPYGFHIKQFDITVLLMSQLQILVNKKGLFGKHLTEEERQGLFELAEHCIPDVPKHELAYHLKAHGICVGAPDVVDLEKYTFYLVNPTLIPHDS